MSRSLFSLGIKSVFGLLRSVVVITANVPLGFDVIFLTIPYTIISYIQTRNHRDVRTVSIVVSVVVSQFHCRVFQRIADAAAVIVLSLYFVSDDGQII